MRIRSATWSPTTRENATGAPRDPAQRATMASLRGLVEAGRPESFRQEPVKGVDRAIGPSVGSSRQADGACPAMNRRWFIRKGPQAALRASMANHQKARQLDHGFPCRPKQSRWRMGRPTFGLSSNIICCPDDRLAPRALIARPRPAR